MDNFNITNGVPVMNAAPMGQLKTNRGLLKTILLTIVTLGIYSIVFYSGVSEDINTIASRYDGKKTMHYCLLIFIIAPITLSIGSIVWFHRLSNRIGGELRRRGINYGFSAATYWGWYVLGTLIVVGPFVYLAKTCKAMNELCADYNVNG